MAALRHLPVLWRARLAAGRQTFVSLLLVAAGMAGALGGGWLIGVWAFGLVLIVESGGLIVWGLARDDGLPDARVMAPPRGARSVPEVLADEARRP